LGDWANRRSLQNIAFSGFRECFDSGLNVGNLMDVIDRYDAGAFFSEV
jgi:hypothetical protein